jgi:general secretion pathway protein A
MVGEWAGEQQRAFGYDKPFAVVALGGTGRAEMAPRSDNDFAFLFDDALEGNPFLLELQRQVLHSDDFENRHGFSCLALPFSLEDAPFVLTPDPRFLLRSKGHHEVLSTLIYGITSQKGLMALIGDVGTGKTMLCRALLRELPKEVKSALVLNPYLSDAELLGTILDDLGVERRGSTKGELMAVLSQYLLTAGGEGQTVVVILDEAQQMSDDALEQIRILSTLETATRKLLQIVLVGQPELEEKLERRELRQLDQRIGIRCYLRPLSKKETFRYIEHRLRIAGLPGALPFARGALMRIYAHSRGIPRVINLVCDRALTAAFSARAREVSPALVKAAIRNLGGERLRRRGAVSRVRIMTPGLFGRAAAVAAGVLLLGAVATAGYRSGWSPSMLQLLPRGSSPTNGRMVAAPTVTTEAPSTAGALAASRSEPAPRAGRGTPPEASSGDGLKPLATRVFALWGVKEDPAQAGATWPVGPGGMVDLSATASRYQLAATELQETNLAEVRAVNLPAILVMNGKAFSLLTHLDGETATLIQPSGRETRMPVDELEASWSHSAWVIWRNVDELPVDPGQDLTPIVVATLGLRLQKLGHLSPPLPTVNSDRFQLAVRRFQTSMGLTPDGIVGPRTTLALSRVVAGRFAPSLTGGSTLSR